MICRQRGVCRGGEDHERDVGWQGSPDRVSAGGIIRDDHVDAGQGKPAQPLALPNRDDLAHALPIKMIATISP